MKTIMLDDREVQIIQAIVMDRNKVEALQFLTDLWERIKGKEPQPCGPKSV